jgi:hypothetical protein
MLRSCVSSIAGAGAGAGSLEHASATISAMAAPKTAQCLSLNGLWGNFIMLAFLL